MSLAEGQPLNTFGSPTSGVNVGPNSKVSTLGANRQSGSFSLTFLLGSGQHTALDFFHLLEIQQAQLDNEQETVDLLQPIAITTSVHPTIDQQMTHPQTTLEWFGMAILPKVLLRH